MLVTPQSDRQFVRFFTLTNLHNNPKISDGELRLFRAAFSKAANSLSYQPDIVIPKAIDPDGVVFAIDLRSLGWDRDRLWHRILTAYPYGINQQNAGDKKLRELAKQVTLLAGTEIPALRVDWFVATATRPPLYYDLLKMPTNARELERSLGVDIARNFGRNQLARAGFTKSGVSRQNRLVERHSAAHGAYWKSYDFKSNDGTGNLYRFPLGPIFDGNTYPEQAFAHDGGEAIFNLPNGLQAYYLVDGKDNRIDAGPLEVVRDRDETSGSVAIVNGVSCMACHYKGTIDFKDDIRAGHGLGGESRAKVEELYPELEAMEKLVKKDQKRFVAALDEATEPFGPFVKEGGGEAKSVTEVGEPVGRLARRYLLTEVGAADAAAELGFESAAELAACIKANPELRALGLGPLAAGGTIKREAWDSNSRVTSAFQEAAQRLDRGTPVVVR